MVSLLRKYQQSLMIFVTAMVIVAFVWLYNGTRLDKIGVDQAFRVYGKTLSKTDIERTAKRFHLAMALGLRDLIGGLSGGVYDKTQAFENFVWNSFVLDHEANALGISPTNDEVVEAMKKLEIFQTNDTFDPLKYQEFGQTVMGPNGISDAQVEDIVRDELRLRKLLDLIGATVEVTPEESRAVFTQQHQKMDVSLIRFAVADFAAAVQPKDDEIKKYFEDHKNTLKTSETRVVRYVRMELNEKEKELKGKDRVAALQKQSERAEKFGQALLEKGDFNSIAKANDLKVGVTLEFAEAQPCPEFAEVTQATAQAFRLTEKEPNSDAIQTETGFYMLHLDKVTPSRPLTFEEAKPKIVAAIKDERGHNALVSKGNETRAKVQVALKAGKSFADAAREAGQKVELVPPFSLADLESEQGAAAEIAEKAVELGERDLSDFVPTNTGGYILHMDKREPVDNSKFKKELDAQLASLRNRKRYAAFVQWMQLCRKAADVQSLEVARPRRS